MEAASAQALGRSATSGGALNRLRSDRRLAERFRAGDDGAFAVLYERHRHRLLAICIGVVGSYEDAQDALDDVRAWLSRVVRNAAIDLVRARRVTDPLADEAPAPGDGNPAAQVEERAEVQELVSSLGRLPEHQRTALVMRELGGSSYAEIAGALEVDETAVRGLIARARLSLRAELEASELACATVREELAHQPDGRRRPAVVRRHLRACDGCREVAAGMRSDARVLRGLAPPAGLGLVGLASIRRLTRPLAIGSAVAKGAFGGGAIQAVVACAVCVTAAEGVRELVVEPAARAPARSQGAAAGPSTAATSTRTEASTAPSGEGGQSATAERRSEARRRTEAGLRRREHRRPGALPFGRDDFGRGGFEGGDGGFRRRGADGGDRNAGAGPGAQGQGTGEGYGGQGGHRSPWRGPSSQQPAGTGAGPVSEPSPAPAEAPAATPSPEPQPAQ
jgi:RNA polymerase sigma factor (sigma-70 family)